jgi:nucleoside-diphosphate-sugar epimerase
MKKILLIGCNGYIGSALVEYLHSFKNYEITGVDINFFKNCFIIKPFKIKVKERSASLLTKNDLKNYDVVIHLAAFSNDPVGNINPKIFYDKTFLYTCKIARYCKSLGIKFIFPSSCSVYGFGKKKVFNERSNPNPLTLYSKNKLLIERKLIKMADRSFNPIILRLATVFGPSSRIRFDLVTNMFVGMALVYKKILLNSDGLSWRPHVFIKDVCIVLKYFIDYDLSKNRKKYLLYNIGDNKNNYQTLKIVKIISTKIKKVKFDFAINKKKDYYKDIFLDKKIINGHDKRSYIVSFNKIRKEHKNLNNFTTLKVGILELIKFLQKVKLGSKKFENKKFYRLQWYNKIKNRGIEIL